MIKIKEALELRDKFGPNTTLAEVVSIIQGSKIYPCPKCKTKGYVTIINNNYRLGDGGFGIKDPDKNITCDLCNGEGYTSKEYTEEK